MIGAVFLCFEGFEKVHQMLTPHADATHAASYTVDASAVEEEKVAGAIRTDFILSAEIMAISLASITSPGILTQAIVLFAVAVLVTAGVYGVVAIIVKADDFGLYLAQRGGTITTAIGQAIVYGMPPFLKMLGVVGLVAMLWVGGGIIIHGLHAYGIDRPEHVVQVIGDAARATIPPVGGLLAWLAGAITSAILGLFIGAITAYAVVPVLTPLWRAVRPAR
jgi:predicted DNA repair protein MutK